VYEPKVYIHSEGTVVIAVVNRYHLIAGPAEQESGANWRAVELHPPKSSASSRRTFTPTIDKDRA